MSIRPLHDRVLIERLEEEVTSGGIVIPDNAKEKPSRGEVLAVGTGRIQSNGDVQALAVKVGDTVLFGQYSGQSVKLNGEELLIMKEDEIYGVIEA